MLSRLQGYLLLKGRLGLQPRPQNQLDRAHPESTRDPRDHQVRDVALASLKRLDVALLKPNSARRRIRSAEAAYTEAAQL